MNDITRRRQHRRRGSDNSAFFVTQSAILYVPISRHVYTSVLYRMADQSRINAPAAFLVHPRLRSNSIITHTKGMIHPLPVVSWSQCAVRTYYYVTVVAEVRFSPCPLRSQSARRRKLKPFHMLSAPSPIHRPSHRDLSPKSPDYSSYCSRKCLPETLLFFPDGNTVLLRIYYPLDLSYSYYCCKSCRS